MLRKIAKTLGMATTLAFLASSGAFAQSTDDVWSHHIRAWDARSVGEIAADYTEDSVLLLNNEIYKGTIEIKNVFTQLFRIFDAGVNRIDTPVVFDRIVYITWHFTPTGGSETFGTDTFVIENGKIAVQTIASPLYEAYPVLRVTN